MEVSNGQQLHEDDIFKDLILKTMSLEQAAEAIEQAYQDTGAKVILMME
jgi:transcriptional regulator with AAA-type ATPase domain